MIDTEMTRTQVQKMERIFILEDEIKFAERKPRTYLDY